MNITSCLNYFLIKVLFSRYISVAAPMMFTAFLLYHARCFYLVPISK